MSVGKCSLAYVGRVEPSVEDGEDGEHVASLSYHERTERKRRSSAAQTRALRFQQGTDQYCFPRLQSVRGNKILKCFL